MERQAAEGSGDGGKDSDPNEFGKDFARVPAGGGDLAGDGADLGRREAGEFGRKWSSGRGRTFPPFFETAVEVGGQAIGMKRGIGIAAGDVENAASVAVIILPGNVEAFGRKQGR